MTNRRQDCAEVPKALKVRPHFAVRELACSCCGFFMYDGAALDKLEALRLKVAAAVDVNSGTRCLKRNQEVKGHPNSGHLYGTSFDIQPPRGQLLRWAELARLVGFKNVQPYDNDGHLHLGE